MTGNITVEIHLTQTSFAALESAGVVVGLTPPQVEMLISLLHGRSGWNRTLDVSFLQALGGVGIVNYIIDVKGHDVLFSARLPSPLGAEVYAECTLLASPRFRLELGEWGSAQELISLLGIDEPFEEHRRVSDTEFWAISRHEGIRTVSLKIR